jgi:hypothetical protein
MPWFGTSRAKRVTDDRKTLADAHGELRIVRTHVAALLSMLSTMNTEQAHHRYGLEALAAGVRAATETAKETAACNVVHPALGVKCAGRWCTHPWQQVTEDDREDQAALKPEGAP